MLPAIQRILIINLGGIGDLILSAPAVRALRDNYPFARLDLLCVGRCVPLMKNYGFFNNVYVYPSSHPLRLLPLLLQLRRNGYDLAVNMRTISRWGGALKLLFMLKLIAAKFTAGRNTDNKGFFFTVKIADTDFGTQPEPLYDIELVERLGASVVHRSIPLPITSTDREYAVSLLTMNGISPHDFIIGINPGGKPSRRWPADRFAELIGLLAGENCRIVLTGSESERELCAGVARAAGGKGIVDLSGLTTVEQLGALIAHCKIFVTNDTGAMHICTAQNVPGVFIFGGGSLTRFAPFENRERYVVLHKEQRCSPCNRFSCGNLRCLKTIPVEEVLTGIRQLKKNYY